MSEWAEWEKWFQRRFLQLKNLFIHLYTQYIHKDRKPRNAESSYYERNIFELCKEFGGANYFWCVLKFCF
jgi:hypothetical protein